jgi:plastocyanin
VRRALGAFAVAAFAVALLASGRPTDDAHAATACVTHTKRVVKHVKRRGRSRRVVRIEHHRICRKVAAPNQPAPATPTTIEPAASSPTPATPTPPSEPPVVSPEPEANALGVAADDHGGLKSYTLSRQTVRPGQLTVQLQNKGEDPHDMDMQRIGPAGEALGEVVEIPVTGPGEQDTVPVTVEPGRYRMWCNLFHHAEEGMEATLTVE